MNFAALPDEDLVALIQKRTPDQDPALRTLESRYLRKLLGSLKNVQHLQRFLSSVGHGSREDFCAEVLGRAILTFKTGKGAKFSTYLYKICSNAIITGYRKKLEKKTRTNQVDEDGKSILESQPDGDGYDPLAPLLLEEAARLARECVLELDERSQRVFVWGVLFQIENPQLGELLPDLTPSNLKQIKCRALARFKQVWERNGGAEVEGLFTMAKVDPDRIPDKRAREAYRVWLEKGDLVTAGEALRIDSEELRKLLLKAMHSLFDKAMLRGERLNWAALEDRLDDIAPFLELADGRTDDPLLDGVGRTLDVVRAAFGLIPVERVRRTLGTFVQERLRKPGDYDDACRELGLRPAALRKLLADQLEPEKEFYDRLSKYLDVPADRLRSLPRRPAGGTRFRLRKTGFDRVRFHAQVLACLAR